jgi:DnaA family protein
MSPQLALDVRLRDASSFENFYTPGGREVPDRLTAAIAGSAGGAQIYLWGEAGSGRSHLLQATCRLASAESVTAAYVPLTEATRLEPTMLEGLESVRLVCLDDMQAVAGNRAWETALFTLLDRVRDAGGVLVAAGDAPPAGLELAMPELVSRLARGLVYQLQPLDDAGKLAAMRLRARNRGFELTEEVARYILNRYPRDTAALFTLLDRIDRASLAHQRRVTIPFVRGLDHD